MTVTFHRTFDRQFKVLSKAQRDRATQALLLFTKDPLHPSLRNHPLKGALAKYRSISAGGDLRLHYLIASEDEAVFIAIGSHSQLYK